MSAKSAAPAKKSTPLLVAKPKRILPLMNGERSKTKLIAEGKGFIKAKE